MLFMSRFFARGLLPLFMLLFKIKETKEWDMNLNHLDGM